MRACVADASAGSRSRRALAGLLVALVAGLLVASAGPAHAHATLLGSDPAEGAVLAQAPERIRFDFSSPVTALPDGVQVYDAAGRALDSSATVDGAALEVTLDQGVPDGTLVVVWRVLSSTDGHPVSGSLSFSVGSASAAVTRPPDAATSSVEVPPYLTAVRWLGYAGLLLGSGLVLFLLVLLPAGAAADVARGRLVRVLRPLVPPTALVWVLGLPLTATYRLGTDLGAVLTGAVWATPTPTEYGVVAAVVLGLGLAVALAGAGSPSRVRRTAALAAAGVAACAPALTGHTRAASPQVLVVGADMVHLLAGSVWLGGVVALALVLRDLSGRDGAGGETLARFSGVAAVALVVLALTGSVQAWRIVGSWGDLLDTGYGQLLLVKLVVVLLAVAVAAWNRQAFVPRLEQGARARDRNAGARLVGRTAAAEAALLVAALLVTGLLVDRNPEETRGVVFGAEVDPAEVQSGMLGAYRVRVTLAPLAVGSGTVTVETRDYNGEPFEGFEAPRVRLSSDDVDLGEVALESQAPGVYAGPVELSASGSWQVQVSLLVTEVDNPVQTFEFAVDGG